MPPPNLYAHVQHLVATIAHETAGAARTRSSLRPLYFGGKVSSKTSGASRRENAMSCSDLSTSLRGAKRRLVRRSSKSEGGSNPFFLYAARWVASLALAMTTERAAFAGTTPEGFLARR